MSIQMFGQHLKILNLIILTQLLSLTGNLLSTAPRGAYVHIPFCRRRCFYCDFPVQIVGDGYPTDKYKSYVDTLCKEIHLSSDISNDIYKQPLETVYFGGGTPSLLPVEYLKTILDTLKDNIGLNISAEITVEIDPGTFDANKLNQWLSIGVNRFSLGIQSFDENILLKCGRAHTLVDINSSLEILSNHSDDINFSIDLISGLPYLTIDTWKDTLDCAVKCGASHISIYDLQIEDKTAFGRWYKDSIGEFPLPSEDISTDMYKLAAEVLTLHGFQHYEVSNYALPHRKSRHNQFYWQCVSTWGFGLSAASFLNWRRYSRPKKMDKYIEWVQGLEQSRSAVFVEAIAMSAEEVMLDRLQDVIMLSLRTANGLDMKDIVDVYGRSKADAIIASLSEAIRERKVVLESVEGGDVDRVRLSDPEGFLVSNDIISTIFSIL